MPTITILHVVDSLCPGGMENGVANIAAQLVKSDVVTHVACLRERGAFASRLPDISKTTVLGKTSGVSIAAALHLGRLIQEQRPDLIHTHNLGPLVYAAIATIWGHSVPILHGEHGQIQPQELTLKRKLLRRLLYHACHTVHTVSTGLLDSLRCSGFRAKRMTAIVNGVDCDRFHPPPDKGEAKHSVGLPDPSHCVLGIVGRFVALKRHHMLFNAVSALMARRPNLHLLVIGDNGAMRDEIVAAMQTHPYASRIHWLGMRQDMDLCYQAMDLLVSPSEIEGLSNAVLESMAAGVPVLAHVACGNNEVIRDGIDGFLRDIRDANTLATAIEEAIADPVKLAQIGALARKRVVSDFSIEAMAASYYRTYQSIIRDTGGAA